ncbi:hypothetical protein V6N11_041390 [Hibiscus sabdariffa]|uniref:Uncharacterized protein n=1 Tax=Hibiscus sabdariffa TaxID=183260 RepID=A0ABR2RKC1_9ROSI
MCVGSPCEILMEYCYNSHNFGGVQPFSWSTEKRKARAIITTWTMGSVRFAAPPQQPTPTAANASSNTD